jgi:hypothetical protein
LRKPTKASPQKRLGVDVVAEVATPMADTGVVPARASGQLASLFFERGVERCEPGFST